MGTMLERSLDDIARYSEMRQKLIPPKNRVRNSQQADDQHRALEEVYLGRNPAQDCAWPAVEK